jgi:hypothetical protein
VLDEHAAADAHATEALGPIDWPAWVAAVAGGVLALVVAITLAVAAHPV